MSEQGNRRPVLYAVTGIAATIAVCLAYYKYSQIPTTAASTLHRSNAVRRPHRRPRRGQMPPDFTIDSAINNLNRRIEQHEPYGRYDNPQLFATEQEDFEDGPFDLLPNNLVQVYDRAINIRPMTDVEKDRLKYHITTMFLQNFLKEEIPPGWNVGEDVDILVHELRNYNVDENTVRATVILFDSGRPPIPRSWDMQDEITTNNTEAAAQSDSIVERPSTYQAIEALAGPPRVVESDDSDDDDDETDSDPGGSQNMLDLLYHIASEQAKREGFIHRNVQCNSCNTTPIQGIRFHCVNCFDFDLCEDCEAQQVHNKTHIFYKIRIPAPQRCHIKQTQPVIYPGLPNAFPNSMPRDLQMSLVDLLGMDKTEMEASYEQFKCLAGEQIPIENDPSKLGMAISRQNFDMFMTPSNTDRPPPPNLIHDRIFAFYDTNNDGVITLNEYIIGLWKLMNKSRGARLKRMFTAFDLDADGFVDRRDFLRMFRAYYALSKELNRELTSIQDELDDDVRDVVQGSQPISAAFTAHMFHGHVSREGQDKRVGTDGDCIITSGPDGVLSQDTEMRGDRTRAIENAAVQGQTQTHPFRSMRQRPETDEQFDFDPALIPYRSDSRIPFAEELDESEDLLGPRSLQVYGWPPQQTPEPEDVINALGTDIPLDDVTDPIDRSKVIHAQIQRLDEDSDKALSDRRAAALREFWTRRQFYLDDEGGLTKPPGYTEPDSSEDGAPSIDEPTEPVPQTSTSSRRQSMRSRSSSKVRFDDSAIDTDHETRSNTSSRSLPVNERWGGFELSGPEKDIGKEILYQTVQQGFNELLDPLFKKKEDEAMGALTSKNLRMKWKAVLDQYDTAVKQDPMSAGNISLEPNIPDDQTLSSNGTNSNGLIQQEKDQASHAISQVGVSQSESSTSSSSTLIRRSASDPTLPQSRPENPSFRNSGLSESVPTPDPNQLDPSIVPPTPSTLSQWLLDRIVDEEAEERGGYGKLSYREFCHLMIQEANLGNSMDGFSGTRHDRSAVVGEAEIGRNEVDDLDNEWSSTADFGKMSFMDTWLETAQF